MTDWIAGTAVLTYLAGVGALTHAVPRAWKARIAQDPRLALTHQMQPLFLPLFLAIAIVGWPGTYLALALTRTHRSAR